MFAVTRKNVITTYQKGHIRVLPTNVVWCVLLCELHNTDTLPFGTQKAPISAKRQPSMTDRMLVGQRLNSRELRDDDVRR